MQIEFTPGGIFVPRIGLWLDPAEPRDTAWISHGHSDHARGLHGHVLATGLTLEIYRTRVGESLGRQALEFGRPAEFCGARLTAYPASHILGAAQLLIEMDGERVVYTGDIKLREPLCGTPTEVVPCHRLIVESTFGLPIFHFLTRDQGRERILRFAKECLEDGDVPVFMGYPLGRGQEIAHVLCQAGIRTAVHGAIARFIPLYERCGFAFPGWVPYRSEDTEGSALVITPSLRNALEASGRNYRFAYVSGWAAMDNARSRAGAEELIPYSDHADFDELLELVERSGAREVDVVHGYTEPFAHILNTRGVLARAPQAALARTSAEEQEG